MPDKKDFSSQIKTFEDDGILYRQTKGILITYVNPETSQVIKREFQPFNDDNSEDGWYNTEGQKVEVPSDYPVPDIKLS